MADGTIKGPEGGELKTSLDNLSMSVNRVAKGWQDVRLQVEPATKAMQNFERGADTAGDSHKTLMDRVKEQGANIRDNVKQWGIVQHQVRGLASSTRQFMGELRQLTSIVSYGKTRIDEIRLAQDAYLSSLNFSTKSHGKLQKYINGINKSYRYAAKLAEDYSIQIEHAEKMVEQITARFGTQIGVLSSVETDITTLMQTSVVLSRMMGVDSADALDYVQMRLHTYGGTLRETVAETQALAVAMDDYTQQLQAQVKHGVTTGAILRKDIYEMIKHTNRLFKIGQFDALAYAKTIAPFMANIKDYGMTVAEGKQMGENFGKMMVAFSDVNNVAHPVQWEAIKNVAENVTSLKDQRLVKRIDDINKRYAQMGVDPKKMTVFKAQEYMGALRGSQDYTLRMIDTFNTTFQDRATRTATLQQLGMTATEAAWLSDALKPGGAMHDAAQAQAKQARMTDEDAKKYKNLQAALKKAAEPTDPRYKAALRVYKEMVKLRSYLKWSQNAILTVLASQAAADVAGLGLDIGAALLGRKGRALRSAGRLGRAARATRRAELLRKGGGVVRGAGTVAAVGIPAMMMFGGAGALSEPTEDALEKVANKSASKIGAGGAAKRKKIEAELKKIDAKYKSREQKTDAGRAKLQGTMDKLTATGGVSLQQMQKKFDAAKKSGKSVSLGNKKKIKTISRAHLGMMVAQLGWLKSMGMDTKQLEAFVKATREVAIMEGKRVDTLTRTIPPEKATYKVRARGLGGRSAEMGEPVSPYFLPLQSNLKGLGTARVDSRITGEKGEGGGGSRQRVTKFIKDAAPKAQDLLQWSKALRGASRGSISDQVRVIKELKDKLAKDHMETKPTLKLVNVTAGQTDTVELDKMGASAEPKKVTMRNRIMFTFDELTKYAWSSFTTIAPKPTSGTP